MADLLDRRLLFVMGKGGVGKSLVAAALSRIALRRGKRVLLVQVNTKDKIAEYLGCPPADAKIREVQPGLFTVNIRPEAALKEYVILQVKLEIIYRLVFENRAVRYFLRAVPALKDLVVLGKIYYHVNQVEKRGKRPLYDLVIVDAPATGHGLFLLRLPIVMLNVVRSGPIFKEATGMLDMLRDPERTAVNLVALPEEMPVAETAEMYRTISGELKMPLGFLFVNAIYPRLFESDDEGRIVRLSALLDGKHRLRNLVSVAGTAVARRKMCEHYMKRLAEKVPLPQARIPYVFDQAMGITATEELSSEIEQEMMNYYGS